jgi:hypothetical protein
VRWKDISNDPDATEVVAWREQNIVNHYVTSIDTYRELIHKTCRGKNVLDFGAANHSACTESLGESSTHSLIASCASMVIAVDVVPFHQEPHPQCVYLVQDVLVEHFQVPNEWPRVDTVFAGHVIEHLDSPGSLFQFANKVLSPCGEIIIATPSPLWFMGLWARSRGSNFSVNSDHVTLYGAGELVELAERNGFRLTSWSYCGRGDMVRAFRPSRTLVGLSTDLLYKFCRYLNTAFSHNQIFATFERGTSA